MAPGVAQDTSYLELHNDMGGRVDNKAVGGHLPLSKRNSTPVSPLAGLLNHFKAADAAAVTGAALPGLESSSNQHRRLDRSHSEPVRGGDGRGANSSRYKTELCRPFEENGFCKYGDKCQFAHGAGELRSLSRHPKYKTELCRTFHTIGFCPYGPRCHFIHNAEERRAPRLAGTHNGAPSAESPSPPASLHGSPTSSGGSFFDDFTLFPGGGTLSGPRGLLEGLTVGLGSLGGEGNNLGLETPPVSPVESLAGDLDSLSLSSASPTPALTPALLTPALTPLTSPLDLSRSLRLPIFEQLCEHD
ncbi:hypothetical protein Pcinc_034102 [Petrolisthes cinctipes]|uniref:C3H1-type domain-containing protein n=1 Tax=Petrolisthes cinctipes TaxID=88211 RepID=A0AAE1EQV5_PETCI|nr:hypothetical protein Pcinc_034102 [Petrolisthes cinctipes]